MRMNDKARRPEQREIFRRLRSAGCPIDLESLQQPSYPLSVSVLVSGLPTEIFPLPAATGIVLPLRIVASVRLTITRIILHADWLKQPVSWLKRCDRHPNSYEAYYCFHECPYGPLRLLSSTVLNWLCDFAILKPGVVKHGVLMGTFADVLSSTAPEKLEATLTFWDSRGDAHPFHVWLNNIKLPANALVTKSDSEVVSSTSPYASSAASSSRSPARKQAALTLAERVFNPAIEACEVKLAVKAREARPQNGNRQPAKSSTPAEPPPGGGGADKQKQ